MGWLHLQWMLYFTSLEEKRLAAFWETQVVRRRHWDHDGRSQFRGPSVIKTPPTFWAKLVVATGTIAETSLFYYFILRSIFICLAL